jgi:hypothetical protein
MVDIDWMPKRWWSFYCETRRVLLESLGYKLVRINKHPGPSGRGLHVWLHISGPHLTDYEKNKFQYLIGNDDPIRAKLNHHRTWRGLAGFWNKLFSKKHRIQENMPKRCRQCRVRRAVHELATRDEIWRKPD